MLLLHHATEFEVDICKYRPSRFKANKVSSRYVLGLPLTELFRHARRLINLVDNDRPPSNFTRKKGTCCSQIWKGNGSNIELVKYS